VLHAWATDTDDPTTDDFLHWVHQQIGFMGFSFQMELGQNAGNRGILS
jgi:hypothetical protein